MLKDGGRNYGVREMKFDMYLVEIISLSVRLINVRTWGEQPLLIFYSLLEFFGLFTFMLR